MGILSDSELRDITDSVCAAEAWSKASNIGEAFRSAEMAEYRAVQKAVLEKVAERLIVKAGEVASAGGLGSGALLEAADEFEALAKDPT